MALKRALAGWLILFMAPRHHQDGAVAMISVVRAESHQLRKPAGNQDKHSSVAFDALERLYLASKQQRRLDTENDGRGEAASDSLDDNERQAELHLIIQDCVKNVYWKHLKERLEEAIHFNHVICISSEVEEREEANRLLQRKLDHPEMEIQFVATIIVRNHCRNPSECRPVNPGDAYIEALRAGVVGWFIEGQPHFEKLGVNRTEENIRSTDLTPENADGGRQIAAEFCRVGVDLAPARIVVLYGDPNSPISDARINSFREGLDEFCPEAKHRIAYEEYANWSADEAASIMAPLFLRDGTVDAVIAANDIMALGALVAAKHVRPDTPLLVAGFDANSYTRPLLQSHAMFATVDQNPPTGLIYALQVLTSDEASGHFDFGPPSECSISPGPTCTLEDYNSILTSVWADLLEDLPDTISTSVQIKTSDPSAQVVRERLQLYNPNVRPPLDDDAEIEFADGRLPPVQVKSVLRDTQIFELYTEDSSILAQGLLVLSWIDPELPWSIELFPDVESVDIDLGAIWTPTVILSNLLKSGTREPLTHLGITVYANGTVVWEQRVNTGEFRCGSIDETVFEFPFDTHHCGIFISSYSVDEFRLEATNHDFQVTVANDDWTQGPVNVTTVDGGDMETVEYRVEMTRDPQFVVLSIIVPSFLLNVISFSQHWIPTRTDQINLDRGGMAITTILAALALRDTSITEVGTAFTLLDVFLLVSLVFQFFGFIITAYESSEIAMTRARESNHLGHGDRLGKVITPILFGIFNVLLSIFWARGVWILFYLSAALIAVVMFVNRADRVRFRKALKEQAGKMGQRMEHVGQRMEQVAHLPVVPLRFTESGGVIEDKNEAPESHSTERPCEFGLSTKLQLSMGTGLSAVPNSESTGLTAVPNSGSTLVPLDEGEIHFVDNHAKEEHQTSG